MPSRFGRVQKATALVPLALLSAAWTAGIAGAGGGVATVSAQTESSDEAPTLPDGTSVPSEAIEAPASLSRPGVFAPGVPSGRAGAADVVRTASTNGIPAAALSAYQRASTVINAADQGCQVSWQLVAAIGRVESDHGRYGGNTLDDDGVSQPGIYGIPLDGSNNTARISDSDAGQFDNDKKWDRAVGPMQFIPSTWSVVGVDADGDGERDPQNINDAALATAVYLCSGNEDLSTVKGQRAAVYRYNNSNEYVDLVLSVMRAYTMGDFSEVPNSTSSSSYFAPAFTPEPKPKKTADKGGAGGGQTVSAGGSSAGASSSGGSGSAGSSGSSGGTSTGSTGGGGGGDTSAPAPSAPAPAPSSPDPVKKTTETVKKTVKETTKQVTGGGGGTSGGSGDGGNVVKDTTKKVGDAVKDTTNKLGGALN